MTKNTPFTAIHEALGAKMTPFAGYNMPVSYTSITDEHLCVRQKLGLFDVSHMGEFIIRGPKALDLVQYISSNDAAKLFPGKVQYSCIPNEQGGIIDDMLVYNIEPDVYMLVVNASNIEKDWAWVCACNEKFGAELLNISDKTALLAIQGPLATQALQTLAGKNMELDKMAYYTCQKGHFAGFDKVLVSATGYTGSGGFEIYFDNAHAEPIWAAIMEAGKPYGLQPIGLGARDTLRLEKGFCLYGNDIDDSTSPLEAGLGWITKFNKDFVGKTTLLAQKQAGINRRLVGFEIQEKAIARHDYPIADANGNIIGKVTSGTQSPSLQKAIGMGYVPTAFSAEGSTIFILIRQKLVPAKVVKIPFWGI